MNFLKGLLKLVVIGVALCVVLWPERNKLEVLMSFDPLALLSLTRSQSLGLLGTVVGILAILAAGDFLFQYHQWYERQKMSLREIKDEFKDTDGDPKIKAKIRQFRFERAQKRMMAEVPKASVVVTNPTHYAVALRYERGRDQAPVVLAKGENRFAQRIKALAAEHGVPVVENKPVARLLFSLGQVGEAIPAELYQAVASILAVVYRTHRYYFHRLKSRRLAAAA